MLREVTHALFMFVFISTFPGHILKYISGKTKSAEFITGLENLEFLGLSCEKHGISY